LYDARDIPAGGIWLFRASRLEALLDPLATLLDAMPPDAVLAPQTVLVPHAGMRQWLLAALARRRGTHGIVANLDLVLTGPWLDGLAQATLGDAGVATRPYRRELLRWRIHAALGDLHDPALDGWLRGADGARRRFQLAERLAGMFTQYLVYRPDWLAAWASGGDPTGDAGFLAPLWRRLRAAIAQPHRGERMARLLAALDRAPSGDADTPLHVFGITHLAPAELAILQAVARRRLVVFHVPDPCRESWSGMATERTRLRERVEREPDALDTESAFLDLGHPLLAKWGRIGQHFLLLLEAGEIAIDERHVADERPDAPASQLQRLQESIRRGEPVLARWTRDPLVARADRSLRVHACHTRLRELEVLRDALLRELAERPGLAPSDIVVMAPDIQAYAPLLPAVFGEAGRHGALPWHLADVAVARTHPLFDAFARLLALPQARVTAPEVVDLLAIPQVADRFGLSQQDVATVAGWLREGRVAWALDPSHRARFGVPPIAEHTFAWGMDRLLAGYATGCEEDAQVVAFADGSAVAPLEGASGAQAALAGALDAVLVEVARWCDAAGSVRTASAWAGWLEQRTAAIFRIDASDAAAEAAGETVLRAIRALATEPDACGLDPELDFAVVRDVLLAALAEASGRPSPQLGGATFCGMVSQRAVPFRVVAVLGLDDGRFPRANTNVGLDPILAHRRIGDRDVRDDDRWLFLQAVMSAREALHLSYVGEGVRDARPRNPAAPLADLMVLLDGDAGDEAGAAGDAAFTHRPWFVRHPLQPFDDRYFDGSDPALFSFRREFAELDPQAAADGPAAPVVDPVLREADASGETLVPLRELLAWFRDPARHFLTRRVGLRLDALEDDRLPESESLESRAEAMDRIARRVFLDCLAAPGRELPEAPPAWLRLAGLLPPGRPGRSAWEAEAAKVRELLAATSAHPLFADGAPARETVAIDLVRGGYRIVGELARSHAAREASWIFDAFPGKRESELDFRHCIGLFVEWALLRSAHADPARPVRLYVAGSGRKTPWQDAVNHWDEGYVRAARGRDAGSLAARRADLDDRLLELVGLWARAQAAPQPYHPRTSWVAATRPAAIEDAWLGGFGRTGECDQAPGYARLLARDATYAQDDPRRAALVELAASLHRCIMAGALSGDEAE